MSLPPLPISVGIDTLDGTEALPGYSFASDKTTGLYRTEFAQLGISTEGVMRMLIDDDNLEMVHPLLLTDQFAPTAPILPTELRLYKKVGINGLFINTIGDGEVMLATSGPPVLSWPLLANPSGSALTPAFSFLSDTSAGMWQIAGSVRLSPGTGTNGLIVSSTTQVDAADGFVLSNTIYVGLPDSPAAGYLKLFVDPADASLHTLSSTGVDTLLGDSGIIAPSTTTLNTMALWGDITGGSLLNSVITVSGAGLISGLASPSGSTDATNKSYVDGLFADDIFAIYNAADSSKQVAFDVSNVSTSTTRTFTIPNSGGLLPAIPATNTLGIGALSYGSGTSNTIIGASAGTGITGSECVILGATSGSTNMGNGNILLGLGVNVAATARTNTLIIGRSYTGVNADGSTTLDPSYVRNQKSASGNILYYNAATGEISQDVAELVTVFNDSAFRVRNTSDPSKLLALDISNVSTSTTRTFIVPNANGILPSLPAVNSIGLGSTSYGSGTANTIVGIASGVTITGTDCVILGAASGTTEMSDGNILIGSNVDVSATTRTNTLIIGGSYTGVNADGSTSLDPSYVRNQKSASGNILYYDGTTGEISQDVAELVTTFNDSAFRVHSTANNSKQFALDLSDVTASSLRTFTVPDHSGILPANFNATSIGLGSSSYNAGALSTLLGVGSGTNIGAGQGCVVIGASSGTTAMGSGNIIIGLGVNVANTARQNTLTIGRGYTGVNADGSTSLDPDYVRNQTASRILYYDSVTGEISQAAAAAAVGSARDLSSGVLVGGIVTVVSATQYQYTAGSGQVVDPLAGTVTPVAWSTTTRTLATINTGTASFVGLNSSGVMVEQNVPFGELQLKSIIALTSFGHQGGVITGSAPIVSIAYAPGQQIRTLFDVIGFINVGGNDVSGNSGVMTTTRASGLLFRTSINYDNVQDEVATLEDTGEDILQLPVVDPMTFSYVNPSNVFADPTFSTTAINPDLFDLPLTSISNNFYTIQRVWLFGNGFNAISPGQYEYKTEALASAAISSEPFSAPTNVAANGIIISYIIIQKGENDASDATFVKGPKYQGTHGGGSSGSAGDVLGPATSSVDALARWSNTVGTIIASSSVTLTSGGVLAGGLYADAVIVSSGDVSKRLQFNCNAITTATTRTLTVPDSNCILPLYNPGSSSSSFALVSSGRSWSGSRQIAIGVDALSSATSGSDCVAIGENALELCTSANYNIAIGRNALKVVLIGSGNIAIGESSLAKYTSATATAVGFQALANNVSSGGLAAFGYQALALSTGHSMTAVGYQSQFAAVGATSCTSLGYRALTDNVSGDNNTACGYNALGNSLGDDNTACGYNALGNSLGSDNTAIGASAMLGISTGGRNICLGKGADIVSGAYVDCIVIGVNTNASANLQTRIGSNNTANCYIRGIHGVIVSGSSAVLVNSVGQLGTIVSSRRYKNNIVDLVGAERLYDLQPRNFSYNVDRDPDQVTTWGLIAEEVNEIIPEIVVKNEDGECETVQYHLLPVLLLDCIQDLKRRMDVAEAQLADFKAEFAEYKLTR